MLSSTRITFLRPGQAVHFTITNEREYAQEYRLWFSGDLEHFSFEGGPPRTSAEDAFRLQVPGGRPLPVEVRVSAQAPHGAAARMYVRDPDAAADREVELEACFRPAELGRDDDHLSYAAPAAPPLSDYSTSFALLRANPRLSGNVKLTCDGDGLWLNPFPLTGVDEATRRDFPCGRSYPSDLARWAAGATPDAVFSPREAPAAEAASLADQHDDTYIAGCSRKGGRLAILAPLYIREHLPDALIILRAPGPVSDTSVTEMLGRSEVVRTFPMGEGTRLGDYIRGMVGSPGWRRAPLSAGLSDGEIAQWRGVDLRTGALSSRGEPLRGMLEEDRPVTLFDDWVTGGFQRHGIACAHVLNLEFVFDDPHAADFELWRYYSLYVVENDLATGTAAGMPSPGRLDLAPASIIGTLPAAESIAGQPRLFYARDASGQHHAVSGAGDTWVSIRGAASAPAFEGSAGLGVSALALALPARPASAALEVGEALPRAYVEVTDGRRVWRAVSDTRVPPGAAASVTGDVPARALPILPGGAVCSDAGGARAVTARVPASASPSAGDRLEVAGASLEVAHVTMAPGGYDITAPDPAAAVPIGPCGPATFVGRPVAYTLFGAGGSPEESAAGAAAALHRLAAGAWQARAAGASLELSALSPGASCPLRAVWSPAPGASVATVPFEGGSDRPGQAFAIPESAAIAVGPDHLFASSAGPSRARATSSGHSSPGPAGEGTRIIVLERGSVSLTPAGFCSAHVAAKVGVGVFSILPVRDFDTRFMSSDYAAGPAQELRALLAPFGPGRELALGDHYAVLPGDSARIEARRGDAWEVLGTYSPGQQFSTVPGTHADPPAAFRNAGPGRVASVLGAADPALGRFPGFPGLRAAITERDAASLEEMQASGDPARLVFGHLISEHMRLKETRSAELGTVSRLTPHISKWAAAGGTDARGNPRRLEASAAFGPTGLSPSREERAPQPELFTHEWPVLIGAPWGHPDPAGAGCYTGATVGPADLRAADRDHFSRACICGAPGDTWRGARAAAWSRELYVPVTREGVWSEAFFRGARVVIRELGADGKPVAGSDRFDGYRFAALARILPPEPDDSSPVSIEVVENQAWKALTVMVTFRTNDHKARDGQASYTALYCAGSPWRPEWDSHDAVSLRPADVSLPGALSLGTGDALQNGTRFSIRYDGGCYSGGAPGVGSRAVIRCNGRLRAALWGQDVVESGDGRVVFSPAAGSPGVTLADGDTHAIRFPLGSPSDWSGGTATVVEGGETAAASLAAAASFASLADMLETKSECVEWTVVSPAGGVRDGRPELALEFPAPAALVRDWELVAVDAGDERGVVAAPRLVRRPGRVVLQRHGGTFEPKFTTVWGAWAAEDAAMAGRHGSDFLMRRTRLAVEDPRFDRLPEVWYRKHSPARVTSGDTLPATDDTPLAFAPLRATATTWDPGRYTLHTTRADSAPAPGAAVMAEARSFMGSKAMRAPASVAVSVTPTPAGRLHTAFRGEEAPYTHARGRTRCRVFLGESAMRAILDAGARAAFAGLGSALAGRDPEAAAREYIAANIIPLIPRVDITVWSRPAATEGEGGTVAHVADPAAAGYTPLRTAKVTAEGDLTFLVDAAGAGQSVLAITATLTGPII